ncbi:MarR family transcriptional regulator [Microbacterium sp. NEAU-LLC]|uniref:MarR family transcriptional regulator n=1 Tax=Microbacterium helvum TaxID=2773713 RepID=A0ABR8NII7_9MICO|nr:MarR family transcriptional regulator [Microbacterium helvum]MBD3940500.1 MarR family transcriptional regulator [Microbacterium helvum]
MNDSSRASAQSGDGAEALILASRALLGVIAKSLADTLHDVTLPQFRVLILLSASGPMRMGSVAARMGAHPSTFSRTVDRLVAAGWVEREINQDSRRETLLRLTPSARALVDGVTARRAAEISRILQNLTSEERLQVQKAMEVFASAAGEPSPADLLVLGL